VFITQQGQLKLGDLGLCRQLRSPSERPRTSAGTLNYMAPELAAEQSYSKPADVWALGCVFYELCALRPAFHSFNSEGLLRKIGSGKVPAIPTEYSDDLRDLVRSMLFRDETRRPSADDILEMPFLQVRAAVTPPRPAAAHSVVLSALWQPPLSGTGPPHD
jgi:NIMA (never in mitosis gene a)-related kinase 1/4/5